MKLIMLNSGWLAGHSREGTQGPACRRVPYTAQGTAAPVDLDLGVGAAQ